LRTKTKGKPIKTKMKPEINKTRETKLNQWTFNFLSFTTKLYHYLQENARIKEANYGS
jgi:hypothetical protein